MAEPVTSYGRPLPGRKTTRTLPPRKDFIAAQLSLFAIRASELADRAPAYDAAVAARLAENVGDDQLQVILAAAFGAFGGRP